jgi:predicted nucleic acid-binding Zn ribbon protein
MKKALTAPAIHFKGSGWAKKDARSAASPAKAGTSAGGDEAGSATGDTAASPKSKSGTSTTPGEKPTGGAADATGQKKPGAAPKSA